MSNHVSFFIVEELLPDLRTVHSESIEIEGGGNFKLTGGISLLAIQSTSHGPDIVLIAFNSYNKFVILNKKPYWISLEDDSSGWFQLVYIEGVGTCIKNNTDVKRNLNIVRWGYY